MKRKQGGAGAQGGAEAQAMFQQALALHRAGRLDLARQAYDGVLAVAPGHAETMHMLGVLALMQGENAQAAEWLAKAVRLAPKDVGAQSNLGTALQNLGRYEEAAACHRKAVGLMPSSPVCHYNLGNALLSLGEGAKAAASFRKAVEIKPDHVNAHNNLGSALRGLGRPEEAESCFRRAVELKPDFASAYINLGHTLLDLGRLEEAAASYDRAARLQPDSLEAQLGLGNVLRRGWALGKAEECYRQAVRLAPDSAEAHYRLAVILAERGRREDSVAEARQAVELAPDDVPALSLMVSQSRALCHWDGMAEARRRLIDLLTRGQGGAEAFDLIALGAPLALQQSCAREMWPRRVFPALAKGPAGKAERIRIGYLSADFRDHPVGHMITGLIENHDRGRFQVTAYSIGPDDGSPTRKRLEAAFEHFVDLPSHDDGAAARRIHDDGTDVLIDLMGHIADSRPGILARRPAPVQVNYFGLPGTMGNAAVIDYILGDGEVILSAHAPFYDEKVVRLPIPYMPFDPGEAATVLPTRQACGLADDALVLCAFHAPFKIMPEMFAVWMRLLAALPRAVLWLLAGAEVVRENLRRAARDHGVAPERLVFAERVARPEHIARQSLADLYLDVTPYNAHTTAAEVLWMGVPTVTCRGEGFASRVASSVLHSVGLAELVTDSLEDYEALVLRLASDPAARAGLRERLRAARATAPLFDQAHLARTLEAAFTRMVEINRAGGAPRSFSVE